jgi:hypothetical protein
MIKNIHLKAVKAVMLALFILLPTIMFAPPFPPNPGGSTPIAPIDGGLIFLLIAGFSYGVYRILKLRKQLA